MAGLYEVDRAFIGPKPDRMRATAKGMRKLATSGRVGTAVMGTLDRDWRQVFAKVIPNVSRETLQVQNSPANPRQCREEIENLHRHFRLLRHAEMVQVGFHPQDRRSH
jgi:hypothetical protein